ncbi:MAG: HAMP domain-containing histidine kinase, partial [Bacteroidetes bacterium]|nr:HAMP domain-containing histidine kinase [Bacteroidota bacterium]
AFDAVRARKLVEQDGYEPRVRVATKQTPGGATITIADNGIGIPEEHREQIFEPFFTTKPSGEGTGLGLSLAYDIVTAGHGGTLGVDARDGEGTTFRLELPAIPLDEG